MLRRKYVPTCLAKTPGGGLMLNIACVAIQAVGAVKNLSSNYQARFMALRDSLEYFDELELNGLNEEIKERG